MKKLIAGLLALTMLLALCACGSKTTTEETPPAETPITQTETPAQETPDASPVASTVECKLFLPNDSIDGVEEKTVTVENNAQSVMDALIENGAAPEGTRVNSAEVDGKTLKLDLSKEENLRTVIEARRCIL